MHLLSSEKEILQESVESKHRLNTYPSSINNNFNWRSKFRRIPVWKLFYFAEEYMLYGVPVGGNSFMFHSRLINQ